MERRSGGGGAAEGGAEVASRRARVEELLGEGCSQVLMVGDQREQDLLDLEDVLVNQLMAEGMEMHEPGEALTSFFVEIDHNYCRPFAVSSPAPAPAPGPVPTSPSAEAADVKPAKDDNVIADPTEEPEIEPKEVVVSVEEKEDLVAVEPKEEEKTRTRRKRVIVKPKKYRDSQEELENEEEDKEAEGKPEKADPQVKKGAQLKMKDEEKDQEEDDDDEEDDEDDPNKLWCICRKPHGNRFMICCDECEDWFHGTCIGINKKEAKEMEKKEIKWFCEKCGSKEQKEALAKERILQEAAKNASLAEEVEHVQPKTKGIKLPPKLAVKRKLKVGLQEAKKASLNLDNHEKRIMNQKTAKKPQPEQQPTTTTVASGPNAQPESPNKKRRKSSSSFSDPSLNDLFKVEPPTTSPKQQAPSTSSSTTLSSPLMSPSSTSSSLCKCFVCNKKFAAKKVSNFCSTKCIENHVRHCTASLLLSTKEEDGKKGISSSREEQREKFKKKKMVVFEKRSGKVLTGENGIQVNKLVSFLKENPTFVVMKPKQRISEGDKKMDGGGSGGGGGGKEKERKKDGLSEKKGVGVKAVVKPSASALSEKQKMKETKDKRDNLLKKSRDFEMKEKKKEKEKKIVVEVKKVEERGRDEDEKTKVLREKVTNALKDALMSPFGEDTESKDEEKTRREKYHHLSKEIEKELFAVYLNDNKMTTTNVTKYLSKYRSLLFNLKNKGNEGLIRRVKSKEIVANVLVKMSSEELASGSELDNWRKEEEKKLLEAIVKVNEEAKEEEESRGREGGGGGGLEEIVLMDKNGWRGGGTGEGDDLLGPGAGAVGGGGGTKERSASVLVQAFDTEVIMNSLTSSLKEEEKKKKQQAKTLRILESKRQRKVKKEEESSCWTGTIFMQDVAKFTCKAILLNKEEDPGDDLHPEGGEKWGDKLSVVGRIAPEQVLDYINKLNIYSSTTTATRDTPEANKSKDQMKMDLVSIDLVKFVACCSPSSTASPSSLYANEQEYAAFFEYLFKRKRYGVIGGSNSNLAKQYKDFYILPLTGNKFEQGELPPPLNTYLKKDATGAGAGAGAEGTKEEPNGKVRDVLLGVLVKKKKIGDEKERERKVKRRKTDEFPLVVDPYLLKDSKGREDGEVSSSVISSSSSSSSLFSHLNHHPIQKADNRSSLTQPPKYKPTTIVRGKDTPNTRRERDSYTPPPPDIPIKESPRDRRAKDDAEDDEPYDPESQDFNLFHEQQERETSSFKESVSPRDALEGSSDPTSASRSPSPPPSIMIPGLDGHFAPINEDKDERNSANFLTENPTPPSLPVVIPRVDPRLSSSRPPSLPPPAVPSPVLMTTPSASSSHSLSLLNEQEILEKARIQLNLLNNK